MTVGAAVAEARDQLDIHCPATGEVVGSATDMDAATVAGLARELRAAQPEWERSGARRRGEWLGAWRDWMLDNSDRLLGLVHAESGKSWGDASIELMAAVESINYAVDHGPGYLETAHPKPAGLANKLKRITVNHRPYPLVGVIAPWNYPLAMPMLDVPAALLAGAAVLSKPSEVTPLAWREAVRGWREEVGAPAVLACATGAGATGEAVIDEADMVQFTGSTATGRRVAARAGEQLKPCSLELGGKDAMIVLADADLERAVGGAVWGGFFNAGQSCTAVERVYVEDAVHDEFVARLADRTRSLRQAMDQAGEFAADLGAMASEAQLAIVERHVADALAKGATAVTGGRRREGEGAFYEPTVLVNVDHAMDCMREETFGPTLPVMRVASAEDAIGFANDSRYGLSASVWTRDHERAKRIADRLEAGAVNVNNVMMNVFQFPAPMAGWKASGLGGRFGGRDGFLKYCRPQALVEDRIEPRTEVHWYPHSARGGRLQGRLTRLLGARDWRRRLGLR